MQHSARDEKQGGNANNISTEQPSFLHGWQKDAQEYMDHDEGNNNKDAATFDERCKQQAALRPNQLAGARRSIQMLSENINYQFDHFRIDKGNQNK